MSNINSIPIHEAKSSLSRLVKKAAAGEVIYIGAYGNPEAAIVPLSMVQEKKPVYMAFGALKNKINLPEGWEDDLPEETIDSFYNTTGLEDFQE